MPHEILMSEDKLLERIILPAKVAIEDKMRVREHACIEQTRLLLAEEPFIFSQKFTQSLKCLLRVLNQVEGGDVRGACRLDKLLLCSGTKLM